MLAYQQKRHRLSTASTTFKRSSSAGWAMILSRKSTLLQSRSRRSSAVQDTKNMRCHYDPVWRRVRIPEEFLGQVCPMAEEIIPIVKYCVARHAVGKPDKMVVWLRPYLFLGAAAIYQREPKSAISRLPAFSDPKVVAWMKDVYPHELAHVNLPAITNCAMRQAFPAANTCIQQQNAVIMNLVSEMRDMRTTLERRTSLLSPNNGYMATITARRALEYSRPSLLTLKTAPVQRTKPPSPLAVYTTSEANDDSTRPTRVHVEVVGEGGEFRPSPLDLVWPDDALRKPGELSGQRPLLLSRPGVSTVTYTADTFPHITEYDTLYDDWDPSKTLDKYKVRGMYGSFMRTVTNIHGSQLGSEADTSFPDINVLFAYVHRTTSWPDGYRLPDYRYTQSDLAKVALYDTSLGWDGEKISQPKTYCTKQRESCQVKPSKHVSGAGTSFAIV
ncbi:hypothetical protein GGX14DRAFT_388115 [Mycena pura]|uniref:Uncharacterized protein n=1 Tax=Mycena pura TaxID=153505 RepID=A0AAD6YKR8_9AGAR|nr:hypothetical protein GGX14DRAFT_388115 [Mycena pura]